MNCKIKFSFFILLILFAYIFLFDYPTNEYFDNVKIPKIVVQTGKEPQKQYVIDMIKERCNGYQYNYFTDKDCIQFFKDNPIQEFPNIIDVFNSFSMGQHKADIFRYYYLYINGGVYLDNDAMFNSNIENFIKNYDCVFVKSFMPNEHIFNGIIATFPKNPIIYKALEHAYNSSNDDLMKNYFHLCEQLFRIVKQYPSENQMIYHEVDDTGTSRIKDDNGLLLASHYYVTKVIPNEK
jgi:mannosyltransferase OCH1-like enzyme